MASEDTQWQKRAACAGAVSADEFFPEKGHNLDPSVKKMCATCPVFVDCLVESLCRREGHGGWAGAGTGTRRVLWRAWMARTHDYRPHCRRESCWCRVVDQHRASLVTPAAQRPRLNLNGPGARHGKASTYARGCKDCGPCTLAYSRLGRRMRDSGIDVLDWWHRWVGDDYAAGKAPQEYDRARVLAGLRLALGDEAEGLHAIGVDVITWWQSWFGEEPPIDPADPRWGRARVLAGIDATEAA